ERLEALRGLEGVVASSGGLVGASETQLQAVMDGLVVGAPDLLWRGTARGPAHAAGPARQGANVYSGSGSATGFAGEGWLELGLGMVVDVVMVVTLAVVAMVVVVVVVVTSVLLFRQV
ncbi:MAG: hypothetical protein ACT6T3_22185, partial [Agrobacterium sp.]